MTRYLLGVVLLLAVALGGAGFLLKRSYTQNGLYRAQIGQYQEAARKAEEQRKKDMTVLAQRAKENAAAAREMTSLRQKLDRALTANQKWAAEPLPKEVSDALAQ